MTFKLNSLHQKFSRVFLKIPSIFLVLNFLKLCPILCIYKIQIFIAANSFQRNYSFSICRIQKISNSCHNSFSLICKENLNTSLTGLQKLFKVGNYSWKYGMSNVLILTQQRSSITELTHASNFLCTTVPFSLRHLQSSNHSQHLTVSLS